jgi:hypothetical protein
MNTEYYCDDDRRNDSERHHETDAVRYQSMDYGDAAHPLHFK